MHPDERAPGPVSLPTARVAPWSREGAALDGVVRRRLFSPHRAMIVICEVAAGPFPAARINDWDEVTTVLSGEIEVRLPDGVQRLGPGQALRVPARTGHAVRAAGDAGAEVLNVLFPPAPPTA